MSITQEAERIVNGQRQADYGDMDDSFRRIAGLWSSYLGTSIDKFDVGKMMILLKVSRAKIGNHRDSYIDIVGYVECIDQMMERDETPEVPPDSPCIDCSTYPASECCKADLSRRYQVV